jgi:hypothetical protein
MTATHTMPPEVNDVFRPLHDQVVLIRIKWGLFRQLFGTDEDHINLLNRFAAGFFGIVQQVMYDDLVQSLFRLTDPTKSCGRPNLCLDRLAQVLTEAGACVAASVQAKSQAIDALLAPFADWRNRRTAHNDLATAQACHLQMSSLQGPSRALIEEVLAQVGELMNEAAAHYGEGLIAYEGTILPPGDGDALVRRLEDLARRCDAEMHPEIRAAIEAQRRASRPSA